MSDTTPQTEVLVWDASGLFHAGRCDRLDVLLDLSRAGSTTSVRHVTTAAVAEELRNSGIQTPEDVEIVHVDNLDELGALVAWVQRLSSDRHDRGEATVCAWAEVHRATAIMDDATARRAAAHAGLDVHGTLWLLARGATRTGSWSSASMYADLFLQDGARYPFTPGGFRAWASAQGLA
ncbi:MAG: hypothetical protein U0Q15_07825 [Kineosporiaceae bacterium]